MKRRSTDLAARLARLEQPRRAADPAEYMTRSEMLAEVAALEAELGELGLCVTPEDATAAAKAAEAAEAEGRTERAAMLRELAEIIAPRSPAGDMGVSTDEGEPR